MFEYRICFVKQNLLKYLSHLDLMKAIERGIRRANLPLAFSGGFHPHPKISYGPALAVGINSTDEYLDLELSRELNPEQILELLNTVLPDGLKILAVKRILQHGKPLSALINRASYLVIIAAPAHIKHEVIHQAGQLLTAPELNVLRVNKDGQKIVNIRPWLHNLTIKENSGDVLEIHLTGEIGGNGNLRPDDIINYINLPVRIVSITRTGLWHETKGMVIKPLDICEKPETGNHD